jgi:hypothetical protein
VEAVADVRYSARYHAHPTQRNQYLYVAMVWAVGCTRCCAMSPALAPSSCNQGCGRLARQLSERAHASSPCLNINHRPLETNKHVVVEPCKRWRRCPVRLQKMTLQCHLLLLRGILSCKDTLSSQPYMPVLSSRIAEIVHDIK